MSLFRLKSWLVAWVLVLVMAPVASAQRYQPFGPVDFDAYHDMQPFAAPDISEYDLGPPQNRNGFFMQYDRLYWSISEPKTVRKVGSVEAEGLFSQDFIDEAGPPVTFLTVQYFLENPLSTDFMRADFVWGNRLELGYQEGKHGWLVSVLQTNSQDQEIFGAGLVLIEDMPNLLATPVDLDADGDADDIFVTLPVYFALDVKNVTRISGVELSHIYRWDRGRGGWDWECFCGARYVNVSDSFTVFGTGTLIVSDLLIDTLIENQIVGPQIGFRASNQRERWQFKVEGRAMAGANFENGEQRGKFASTFVNNALVGEPAGLNPIVFANSSHNIEFAPLAELRVDVSYDITKTITARVGYSLLAMDGISRASERVLYTLPSFGISEGPSREELFMNGVNFGIEINR